MVSLRRLEVFMWLLCLPISAPAAEYPEQIRLFVVESPVDVDHPTIDIRLYDMNEPGSTARQLSDNLSTRASIAELQAKSRIEDNFAAIKKALQHEVEIHLLIDKFNIQKYPAAVVNDQFVIYGTTRLEEIVSIWQNATR